MNVAELILGAILPLLGVAAVFVGAGVLLAGRSEDPLKFAFVSYLAVGIAIFALQTAVGGRCEDKPTRWLPTIAVWPNALYDWTVVNERPFAAFFTDGLSCEPVPIAWNAAEDGAIRAATCQSLSGLADNIGDVPTDEVVAVLRASMCVGTERDLVKSLVRLPMKDMVTPYTGTSPVEGLTGGTGRATSLSRQVLDAIGSDGPSGEVEE